MDQHALDALSIALNAQLKISLTARIALVVSNLEMGNVNHAQKIVRLAKIIHVSFASVDTNLIAPISVSVSASCLVLTVLITIPATVLNVNKDLTFTTLTASLIQVVLMTILALIVVKDLAIT
jgi:hypothetical protein